MDRIIALVLIGVLWGSSLTVDSAVILQYHHISNNTPKSTSLSPALFEQHMDYLEKHDFKVISLTTFISRIEQKVPFDDKSVLITFDDGYSSVYEEALPILSEKKYPFVVFVNGKPIEQNMKGWMSWEELKTLQMNKGEIANHSFDHLHLIRRLQNESLQVWEERIIDDLQKNQKLLEKRLNVKNKVLAYPYGEYDTQNLKPLLLESGYFGFAQHSGAVSIKVDQQAIPRFAFGGNYGSMEDFKTKVLSLPLPSRKVDLLDIDGRIIESHIFKNKEVNPKLRVRLDDSGLLNKMNCFFSGQGILEKEVDGNSATFSLKSKIKPGRSRFNCTAPSNKKGRFYWFSQPIIKSLPNGQWYKE